MRLLWTGGPVDFLGRHFELYDAWSYPVPEPAPRGHRRWRETGRLRGWRRASATAGRRTVPTTSVCCRSTSRSLAAHGRSRAQIAHLLAVSLDKDAAPESQPLIADMAAFAQAVAGARRRRADRRLGQDRRSCPRCSTRLRAPASADWATLRAACSGAQRRSPFRHSPQIPTQNTTSASSCGRPTPLGVSLCENDNPAGSCRRRRPRSTARSSSACSSASACCCSCSASARPASGRSTPPSSATALVRTAVLDVAISVQNSGSRPSGASCRISNSGTQDYRDYTFFTAPIAVGESQTFSQTIPPAPDQATPVTGEPDRQLHVASSGSPGLRFIHAKKISFPGGGI